jgi:site-specific DNA-methyltransferase (adenine-specific)
MAFELNKIHHSDWMNNGMPDKSVKLLIADPPYFEVKGEFDFIWKTFDEYLQQVELWAKECKRLLADNGTLFWYGHAKKIAYAQIIFDRYFHLENDITIEFNRQTKKGVEQFRCFAPVSERVLMYANYSEDGNDCYSKAEHFAPIINYLRNEFKKANEVGYKTKEFRKLMGLNEDAGGIRYFADNVWIFPTEEHYVAFQKTGFFKKAYSDLLEEFENCRRYFNNFKKLFDVMQFDQEAHITKEYAHDTCKPETLTRAIILTCSRPKDLVFIPFAGSGTEVAMALKEGRTAIGFDTELKYVEMGNKRTDIITSQPNLFN